jgi:hypothetical protein
MLTLPSPAGISPEQQSWKKKDTIKPIENPLLLAGSPGAAIDLPSSSANALTMSVIPHGGLRQRRTEASAAAPPKASFSLETGVDVVSVVQHLKSEQPPAVHQQWSPLHSTTGCWVLVYGYATSDHYDEIRRRFSEYGHVLSHRGSCQPGQSNWIALQYESRLQSEKALCHQHVQLADGIFCGVKRLDDTDPILLQSSLSRLWSQKADDIYLSTTSTSTASASLKPKANGVNGYHGAPEKITMNGSIEEKDILLYPETREYPRNKSLCEKLLRWLLSID